MREGTKNKIISKFQASDLTTIDWFFQRTRAIFTNQPRGTHPRWSKKRSPEQGWTREKTKRNGT